MPYGFNEDKSKYDLSQLTTEISDITEAEEQLTQAINTINQSITTINNLLGSGSLDTTSKTVIPAINELNDKHAMTYVEYTLPSSQGNFTLTAPTGYTSDNSIIVAKQHYDSSNGWYDDDNSYYSTYFKDSNIGGHFNGDVLKGAKIRFWLQKI